MNSQEFFKLFEGQWVSQRTHHHILTEETKASKADLWIEALEAQSEQVTRICTDANLDPQQVIGSFEITWKGTLSDGKTQLGSTVMIAIADAPNANQGHLISQPSQGSAQLGRFELGEDEVMTFTVETDQGTTSERIWYASENLRIRSNTLQKPGVDSSDANFCSEIRRVGKMLPKPGTEEVPKNSLAAWRSRYQNQTVPNNPQ